MDLNKFRTDQSLEQEGVWVDLGKSARILIARLGNKKYNGYVNKLMAPHRKASRAGGVDDSIAEEVLNKALAKYVLLDWEGFEEDGKPVKYSYDEAYRILSAEEYSDFRELVVSLSSDMANFQQEREEEDLKNSKSSSTGS